MHTQHFFNEYTEYCWNEVINKNLKKIYTYLTSNSISILDLLL